MATRISTTQWPNSTAMVEAVTEAATEVLMGALMLQIGLATKVMEFSPLVLRTATFYKN